MARKIHSTSNPNWAHATTPADIIPKLPASAKAKEILRLSGLFILSQGEHAGDRFGDHRLDWQNRLTVSAFHPQIREVFVKMGKGSGKTTLVASWVLGACMYYAGRGMHARSQICILSANVSAADIMFSHVLEAVGLDPDLADQFSTNAAKRELKHKESGIVIRISPPSMAQAVGRRSILLIIDETHQAALESRNFTQVVDQLKRGGQNFEDFLMVNITTSPAEISAGYYADSLARARATRDGKRDDPSFLPALFEFPHRERDDIEPDDENEWWRGMPSLITESNPKGTIHINALRRELDEALKDNDLVGGDSLSMLLSQRLGIEPEERQGGGLTPMAEFWEQSKTDVFPDLSAAQYTTVACDPSPGLSDPFAIVLQAIYQDTTYWMSRQFLTNHGYDKAPEKIKRIYDQAIKAGELSLHTSPQEVENAAFAWVKDYVLPRSPWATCGGDAAGVAGFTERFEMRVGVTYNAVPMGWQLLASYHESCSRIASERLLHLGQPLLTENVRNVALKNDRLTKRDANASGVGWAKIDGAHAGFAAVHLHANGQAVDIGGMIG